jgi:hypothetical protein
MLTDLSNHWHSGGRWRRETRHGEVSIPNSEARPKNSDIMPDLLTRKTALVLGVANKMEYRFCN